MKRFSRKIFVNEYGNEIEMKVSLDKEEESVVVIVDSPTSITDHTWTEMEATELLFSLAEVLNYKLTAKIDTESIWENPDGH